MPSPRLLVLASTYPKSSSDATPGFVRDLALREADEFQVRVVVPAVPGAADREIDGPLEIHRFRFFPRRWEDLADGAILENLRSRPTRWLQVPFFMLAEIIAVWRAVRRHRPDVIHVHWLVPQGVAALVAAPRVPKVVTTLGGDLYGLRDPISRRLKAGVARNARFVTTMNSDMREQVVRLGAAEDRTQVLPVGADVATVRQAARGVETVRRRVLFVGRLVEKKGLTYLLEAARGLDVQLVIVGDGPLRSELEQQAAGLDVDFRGSLSRAALARELAASEIVVFPSIAASSGDQDGLPVALLEAMAVGSAVIVSSLPGLRDAVVHDESGLHVPPADSATLAAAIRRLLTDGDLRARLSAAASSRAEQFSADTIGRRYVQLLRVAAGLADE